MTKEFTRRDFLKYTGLTSVAFLGSAASLPLFDTTELLETNAIQIQIPGLPAPFESYKIGFISDIHLGISISLEFVAHAMEELQKHQPDLLILGGDYLWIANSIMSRSFKVVRNKPYENLKMYEIPPRAFTDLAKVFSGFKAPNGVYGILGNHDRWHAPKLCTSLFADRKIQILVNETVTISRGESYLTLIGIDDYMTGQPRFPSSAKVSKNKNEFRVLASHNPDYVADIIKYSNYELDFSVCGHTHGGQIKIPLLNIAPKAHARNRNMLEGLYKTDRLVNYTSKGIGVVEVPYRISCPPEISIFTFTGA
jgi:uncharacterized protein